MGIRLKANPLPELKRRGYSSYRLFQEGFFGSATIQKFRKCGKISMNELERLCCMLNCQPGDLLEYVPDESGESE